MQRLLHRKKKVETNLIANSFFTGDAVWWSMDGPTHLNIHVTAVNQTAFQCVCSIKKKYILNM